MSLLSCSTSRNRSPTSDGPTFKTPEQHIFLKQVLKEEQTRNKKRKRNDSIQRQGRALRRVITCYEPLLSLIAEADRRACLSTFKKDEEDNLSVEDRVSLERFRERNYTAYKLLIAARPQIPHLMKQRDVERYLAYVTKLQDGANAARADDNSRINKEIAKWLNKKYKLINDEALSESHRSNRGLRHRICGSLLTPIDIDWENAEARLQVQNGTNAKARGNFFLRCLYPSEAYNPNRLEDNFLKGELLLLTFTAIFVSPTVEEDLFDGAYEEDNRAAKRQKMPKGRKNCVAAICNMEGRVTGRAIAYAAVMLILNLTDTPGWTEEYGGINFPEFYDFLVDYFEAPRSEGQKTRTRSLLSWWSRHIFPNHQPTASCNARISYKKLAAQQSLYDD